MLGDKGLLNVNYGEKSSFMGQIQETRYVELLEQKDKQIKNLKRTIKKLEKQLKQKKQLIKVPESTEGRNSYFKTLIQREVSRYNQLRKILFSVIERVKKLSAEIDHSVSISSSNQSMKNLAEMLQKGNNSSQRQNKSSFLESSSSLQGEQIQEVDHVMDHLEITMRGILHQYGQNNKNYKQSLEVQKSMQEDISNYQKQIKRQKKSKDLLQKLLQKNETQKNELVNQINTIANHKEMQSLKIKTKDELIAYYCKLNYRIKDLQKQKEQYIKASTRDMEKQVKLYQQLLNKVKNMKDRSRMGQSAF